MFTLFTDTSAGTGKLCILGHLGLVFIWSCFVSRLLFLLFYVSLRNLCSGTCRKIPLYWPPRSRNNEVLQHGDSILGSVILCGTFRRISNLWDNAHTLKLKNCLLYLSSTISQVFDFIRCTVFDFIFIA